MRAVVGGVSNVPVHNVGRPRILDVEGVLLPRMRRGGHGSEPRAHNHRQEVSNHDKDIGRDNGEDVDGSRAATR